MKICEIHENPRKSDRQKKKCTASLAQSGIARNHSCGVTWLNWGVAGITFSPIGQTINGMSWQRQSCSSSFLGPRPQGPKGTDPQPPISLRV